MTTTQAPDRDGWHTVTCKGCGAQRQLHDLMNANSPAVNLCPYCKTPQFSQEVLERVNERISGAAQDWTRHMWSGL